MTFSDRETTSWAYFLIKISIDDKVIKIEGFTPKCKDLVNNATHGGVAVYLKNTLAYKQLHHLEFDPNILILEIYFGRKKVFFTTVYRLRHSQTIEQERDFVHKLDNLCSLLKNMNPYASIFVGDFNAHNRSWWNGDRTDPIGSKLEKVFMDNSLTQLVKEPAHLRDNSSSCIDLVVTSQPNLLMLHPAIYS